MSIVILNMWTSALLAAILGSKMAINNADINKKPSEGGWKNLPVIRNLWALFLAFDRRVDGAATFFVRHYGKTRFMVAMSKRLQVLGLERLWEKGPKAFVYFFLFYLIRDTILYIIIPIWVARMTTTQ